MAFLCLQHVQELYGNQTIDHAILIANSLVPTALCNEKYHGHVLVCILGNYYLENVKQLCQQLAGMHARPISIMCHINST